MCSCDPSAGQCNSSFDGTESVSEMSSSATSLAREFVSAWTFPYYRLTDAKAYIEQACSSPQTMTELRALILLTASDCNANGKENWGKQNPTVQE